MGLYLTSNQQQIGPYEIAQVNQMLVAQQIGVETLFLLKVQMYSYPQVYQIILQLIRRLLLTL